MSAAEKISTQLPSYSTQGQMNDLSAFDGPDHSSAEKRHSDYLSELERQMKDLWSQYISCLDKNGLSERAKSLRDKYFGLYRCYRHNKEWRRLINTKHN